MFNSHWWLRLLHISKYINIKIHDMEKTIYKFLEASTHPVSVVIIGIGDADFGNMKILEEPASHFYFYEY